MCAGSSRQPFLQRREGAASSTWLFLLHERKQLQLEEDFRGPASKPLLLHVLKRREPTRPRDVCLTMVSSAVVAVSHHSWDGSGGQSRVQMFTVAYL
ncbi:uncharacterized protein LOC109616403 isoform X2 [Esox lucius]|uniref:uncharacterized protein LOC109616403 isoform X2 n=1 Tax=Esox lucius TaxID=8010 RepID=UPI0009733310|nr:uncharacterized protein LOC109616403 isoform X2 [Esox lucius]